MFIYLYLISIRNLIHICSRFIGGRLYNDDRTKYIEIDDKSMIRASDYY